MNLSAIDEAADVLDSQQGYLDLMFSSPYGSRQWHFARRKYEEACEEYETLRSMAEYELRAQYERDGHAERA